MSRNVFLSEWVRNPACIMPPVPAISPFNSRMGWVGGGVLITPRHMLLTNHMKPYAGYDFTFVDGAGKVHKSKASVETMVPWDTLVVTMETPLPRSVPPIVFPTTPPKIGEEVWWVNKHERVSRMKIVGVNGSGTARQFWIGKPDEGEFEPPVNLDSGSPVIRFVNRTPTLVGILSNGYAGGTWLGGGECPLARIDAIKAAIGGEALGAYSPPMRKPTRVI